MPGPVSWLCLIGLAAPSACEPEQLRPPGQGGRGQGGVPPLAQTAGPSVCLAVLLPPVPSSSSGLEVEKTAGRPCWLGWGLGWGESGVPREWSLPRGTLCPQAARSQVDIALHTITLGAAKDRWTAPDNPVSCSRRSVDGGRARKEETHTHTHTHVTM